MHLYTCPCSLDTLSTLEHTNLGQGSSMGRSASASPYPPWPRTGSTGKPHNLDQRPRPPPRIFTTRPPSTKPTWREGGAGYGRGRRRESDPSRSTVTYATLLFGDRLDVWGFEDWYHELKEEYRNLAFWGGGICTSFLLFSAVK